MRKLSRCFYWFVVGFAIVTLLMAAVTAYARDVTLKWEHDGKDAAGFKVYYDTDGGTSPYAGMGADQGPSPVTFMFASSTLECIPELAGATMWQCQLTGLRDTPTWIAVTAWSGVLESELSNEVMAFGIDYDPRKPLFVSGVTGEKTEGEN